MRRRVGTLPRQKPFARVIALPFAPAPPANAPAERRALVALLGLPGIGPARARALAAHLGSFAEAFRAPARRLAAVPNIGPEVGMRLFAFDGWEAVDDQFRRAERAGAATLAEADDAFPPHLRTMYDPPALLWRRGTLLPQDERAVAVVGTRRATDAGRRAAYRLAYDLAEAGWTVVSGLAYGIDAAAHEGALDAGGRTVAVLGSGVDRIYPSRHRHLAERIAASGALLSEEPMGAKPDAVNFPKRNRLIAGMTRGTVVAEAFESGGALLTARLALDYNREVFALPWDAGHEAGAGGNRLIQRGEAQLVLAAADVLSAFGEAVVPAAPKPSLPHEQQRVADALAATPLSLDDLCAALGLDAAQALVTLLAMEMAGTARRLPGGLFAAA